MKTFLIIFFMFSYYAPQHQEPTRLTVIPVSENNIFVKAQAEKLKYKILIIESQARLEQQIGK